MKAVFYLTERKLKTAYKFCPKKLSATFYVQKVVNVDDLDFASNEKVDTLTNEFTQDLDYLSDRIDQIEREKDSYTKEETDALLTNYATNSRVDTISQDVALNSNQIEVAFQTMEDDKQQLQQDIDTVDTRVDTKQDLLVSGTNIKTINNQNILGEGDITIQAGASSFSEITGSPYDNTNLSNALNSKTDATEISRIDNQLDVINETIVDDKSELQNAIGQVADDVETLESELNNKADKSEIPTVPTNLSSFTNDTGFITQSYHDNTKQDVISDLDEYAKISDIPDVSNFATKDEIPSIPTNLSSFNNDVGFIDDSYHDITKQNVISNLATIESNAQAGKNASETIQTYGDIVSHNADEFATNTSLTTGLASKQNTISDLEMIRQGAELGATALQSVPSEYVTETELENYHDTTKQDTISDLNNIRSGASKGLTSIQNTNDCVHIAGNETCTGVKTFNGGKGGNDVGIKSLTGMSIGAINATAYTQYATIRNCNNQVHTGSYYINSDGSVLFRHKTGTALAEGTVNDATFQIHPVDGITAAFSGKAGTAVATPGKVLVSNYTVQKGISTSVASSEGGEITLARAFPNTNFVVMITPRSIGNYFVSSQITATNKFKVRISDYYGNPVAVQYSWVAIED